MGALIRNDKVAIDYLETLQHLNSYFFKFNDKGWWVVYLQIYKFMSTSFYDKLRTLSNIPIVKSELTFSCSKSTIETQENGVKYVQS